MPTCGRDIGMGWTPGGGAIPGDSKGTVMPEVMNGIRQAGDKRRQCRAGGYRAGLSPGDAYEIYQLSICNLQVSADGVVRCLQTTDSRCIS